MGALARLRALVQSPEKSREVPSALLRVKLTRKLQVDGGAGYNTGEIVGVSPTQAADLVRKGYGRLCGPTAKPDVKPREDPVQEYRLAAWDATELTHWHSEPAPRDAPEWSVRWLLDPLGLWR